MFIQFLANGAAVVAALFLAHKSSPGGLIQKRRLGD